ncbi:MAG TPA: DUF87 domain-containing protein [Herpetosiphonaceae bacterium]
MITQLRLALAKPVAERVAAAPPGTMARRRGSTTLADLVAPHQVRRRMQDRHVVVGDSFVTTLEVRAWPPALGLGWWSDLATTLQGVTLVQYLDPLAPAAALALLKDSERAGRETQQVDAQHNGSTDLAAQDGTAWAAQLRTEIHQRAECLLGQRVYVRCAAGTQADLEALVASVRDAASRQGIQLLPIPLGLQWDGYVATLPLALDPVDFPHDVSGRAATMSMATEVEHLPTASPAALLVGEHPQSGAPLLHDHWAMQNPHAVVVAESGSGKTYLMSGLMAQEVAVGATRVLILDPKRQEYRHLVEQLGGTYISLGGNARTRINPLAIPQLGPARWAKLQAEDVDLVEQRITVVNALLVGELTRNGSTLDSSSRADLEQALAAAYATAGITSDPATWAQPMPTLSDVQTALAAINPQLAPQLRLWTEGTLGRLFNHPTTVPTGGNLLAIDIWGLLQSNDERLQAVVPVIVTDFLLNLALADDRQAHLYLDEAHALIKTDAGAKAIELVYRIGRSLKIAATIITQQISDLDDSERTRTILGNSQTKYLLGVNGTSSGAQRVQALLSLSDEQTACLAACRKDNTLGSTWLLLAGETVLPVLTPPWPEPLHTLIVP